MREGLRGMTEMTGLGKKPGRIEAYDISNTGSSEIVASMVVFVHGISAKKEYRRFKIRSMQSERLCRYAGTLYRRLKPRPRAGNERKKKRSRK